jgi:hypothetical protein
VLFLPSFFKGEGVGSRQLYQPIRAVYVNIFKYVSSCPHSQTENFSDPRKLIEINYKKYVL